MWNVITSNPDAVLLLVTTLLGLFGANRWRAAVRDATAFEVDRWASTAAAAMAMAIRAGVLGSNEAALNSFLTAFRQLAVAAGVKLTPALEQRALGVAHEQLTIAGRDAVAEQLTRLKLAADHVVLSMAKLPASR